MGIIQGNAKKDITPWICSKYTNCSFAKRNGVQKFTIYITDFWALEDKILIQQRVDLHPELYEQFFGGLVPLIRKMIDKGYYPTGTYNEEYIPGKWCYQKTYRAHDYILIGYDDITQNFISIGYRETRRFERYLIPYENMEQALRTVRAPKIRFGFFEMLKDAKFDLDMPRMLSGLTDYLESKNSLQMYTADKFWGMDAIRHLADLLVSSGEKDGYVDERYTRGLMEHKFFMRMRMDYLLKNGYLSDGKYLELSTQAYQIAERAHMLGLKYNLTRKATLLPRLHEMIDQILEIEIDYLPQVLSELRKDPV